MPPTHALILMGLRCSGKTTIGRLAAERLGIPFVDLDDETAALLAEPTPGDALRRRGEPAFRAAETAALLDQLQRITLAGPIVLALGGGTPTAAEAPEVLRFAAEKCRCRLVYLHASPLALRSRLEKADASARPSLTAAGVLDEVAALYDARDPLYRSLAQHTFEAGASTPQQLADDLTAWLASPSP
ncbi:MAG: shikimate kinase [Phycisphaerales bacterium]